MSLNLDIKKGLKRLLTLLSVLWFVVFFISAWVNNDAGHLFFVLFIPLAWAVLYALFWVADGFKKKDENSLGSTDIPKQKSSSSEIIDIQEFREKESYFEELFGSLEIISYLLFLATIPLLAIEGILYIGTRILTDSETWIIAEIILGPFIRALKATEWHQQPQSMFFLHEMIKDLDNNSFPLALYLCPLSILLCLAVEPINKMIGRSKDKKIKKLQNIQSSYWLTGQEAYERGDPKAARDIWGVLAAKRNDQALKSLAKMYEKINDNIQAYIWRSIPLVRSFSFYDREEIENKMNSSEVKEAQILANEWLKKHRTQKQIDDAKKLEVDYLNESIKFCKEELEQIEEEQNNLIAEFDRNKIELRSQFQEENIRVERESIEGLLDDSLENELQNNRDWLAEELSTSSSIFKEDKSELTARRRQCEESLIRYKEKLNEMERDLN